MGCTHSRSEDLYKKSIINSETFIGSITDTPGYFSRTVHTLDFVESKFPNPARTEMSYTGPPSHLQNSIDVHPFWSEFGREFLPADRFHDKTNGDVPRSLLPGTDTAQEMRNLEHKEALNDLRSQVKAKMIQSRPIPEEDSEEPALTSPTEGAVDEIDSRKNVVPPPPPPTVPVSPPPKALVSPPPTAAKPSSAALSRSREGASFQEEKSALDFLDSVILESMQEEDDEVSLPVATVEDANWSLGTESFMKVEMRRRNMDKPVPGVMHGVAPVGTRNSYHKPDPEPSSNGGPNVLRTSMYLPDASFVSPHSAAMKSGQQTSLQSYRVEMRGHPNPLGGRPRPKSSIDFPIDRPLKGAESNVSIDTGIFSDSGTTNSASSNDSGIGSSGVKDLVKLYNEQRGKGKSDPSWKRHSTNLDHLGRSPLPGRGQSDSLPLDEDSVRVPRNSAILEEIRKELQLNIT